MTVDGGGLNRVFDIDPTAAAMPFTATFRGLIIQGGVTNVDGAGIRASGAASVTLDRDNVLNNLSLTYGAGIAMEPSSTGSLTLLASHVLGNRALTSGGGIAARGTGPIMIGPQSEVAENYVFDSDGGGVWLAGSSLTVTGANIHDNRAINGNGGGIDNSGAGAVVITGSIVAENSAKTGGGYADSGAAPLTIVNSFILDNAAGSNGGGLDASGPMSTLTNTTVSGNAAVLGGGMHISGTGTTRIADCSIAGNGADGSGGIADEATMLIVTGTTFATNRALGSGGAIGGFNTVGDVSISNSLFRDNQTYISGGALFFIAGTLEVAASRFTGNASQSGGAGNLAPTSFSIVNSTFDANRAFVAGGLVLAPSGTANVLSNDTFSGNSAKDDGALRIQGTTATILTMIDDTIAGNTTTGTAGGMEDFGGALVVQGTILAGNTAAGAPSDFTYTIGTLTDKGGNLLGSTAGSSGKFGPGTIVGDPKLGPLAANGGQVAGAPADGQIIPTMALLPGSPAYGKGVAAGAPTNDERGFARHASPSIGAYESQYSNTAPANPLFVDVLYEILFNHPVDPAGLVACTNFLNNGGSPTALIQILQSSNEYLDDEVAQLFHRYLDRAPTSPEFSSFSAALKSGATPEQVAAVLVGSNEFFQDYGGNNDGFVLAAYQTTLGRAAAPSEVAGWDQVLAGGMPRSNVAGLFLSSQEYLTDLIVDDFEAYLGRDPSPSDLSAFLGAAKAGVTSPMLASITLAGSYAART